MGLPDGKTGTEQRRQVEINAVSGGRD
jgi:hypothetical protein